MGMGREKGRGSVNVTMLIGDGRSGQERVPLSHHPIRDPDRRCAHHCIGTIWQVMMMNDAGVGFNSDNMGRYTEHKRRIKKEDIRVIITWV